MIRKLDKVNRICLPNLVMDMGNLSVGGRIEIYMSYGDIHVLPVDEDVDWKSKPQVGMIRTVGVMNRITLPAEYVGILHLKKGDEIDISVVGGVVILKII